MNVIERNEIHPSSDEAPPPQKQQDINRHGSFQPLKETVIRRYLKSLKNKQRKTTGPLRKLSLRSPQVQIIMIPGTGGSAWAGRLPGTQRGCLTGLTCTGYLNTGCRGELSFDGFKYPPRLCFPSQRWEPGNMGAASTRPTGFSMTVEESHFIPVGMNDFLWRKGGGKVIGRIPAERRLASLGYRKQTNAFPFRKDAGILENFCCFKKT